MVICMIEKNDFSNIGERLMFVLKYNNIKKATLAKDLCIKPQTIQFLCSGKAKSSKYIQKIANYLNVDPDWLRSGQGAMLSGASEENPLLKGYSFLPILSYFDVLKINQEAKIKNFKHNKCQLFLGNFSEIFCLILNDDCMKPTYNKDDLLFVKKDYYSDVCILEKTTVHKDKVFVMVSDNQDVLIRKICVNNHKVIAYADNNNIFRDIHMNHQCRLVGYVVGHMRTQTNGMKDK